MELPYSEMSDLIISEVGNNSDNLIIDNFTEMIFPSNISNSNFTTTIKLPIDMTFNDGHILSIVVYSFLFVFGATGNIKFLTSIKRYKYHPRLNRINMFLMNLAIADLLVTFLLMPLEISWAITVSWRAGDLACRVLSFFRTFGLYLSGFILICICLDCYFAVLKPLSLTTANRRGRIMLWSAWIGSILCSLPQVIIFHVEKHPVFPWYEQCVTFNFFSSKATEMVYNVFGFIVMYGLPLTMIIFCYGSILCEVIKVSQVHEHGKLIRISNIKRMGRAKVRTLKLTVTIVATFFLCWTPYNIMSLWYWIDKDSAYQVDQKIQKGFFLFAVANSCFNPLVYGYFNKRKHEERPMEICENNNVGTRNKCNGHILRGGPDFKIRATWKKTAECISCHVVPSTSSSSETRGGGAIQQQQINYVNESENTRPPQQGQANGSTNTNCKPFYLNTNLHSSMPIISNSKDTYVHTELFPTFQSTSQSTLNYPKKSALTMKKSINLSMSLSSTRPYSPIRGKHVTFTPKLVTKFGLAKTSGNITKTIKKKKKSTSHKCIKPNSNTTFQVKVDIELPSSSAAPSHCFKENYFDVAPGHGHADEHNELKTYSWCD